MDRIEIQILRALVDGEISVYKLIDSQDASLSEFLHYLNRLVKEKIVYLMGGKIGLTEKGKKLCNKEKIKNIPHLICECCNGTGYNIPDYFKNILERYKIIAKNRPQAIEKYDQGFISHEGVIKRVEFVYDRGDLYGKIFVLGDDDLFSIAASLTGMPKKIFVVDIDERLINFINKVASEHSLNVEAMIYDVQSDFPKNLRKRFDVFVTDPVETIPGLKLFLSRGVSTLKGIGCSAYFGITTLEASRKKWGEIQQMIYDMGFVITDIRRKFNVYPDENNNFFRFQEKLPIVKKLGVRIDHNWYKSSLFRIETFKEPKPLVEGKVILDEKIYKDDESLATPY
jgi:hypothetical protein